MSDGYEYKAVVCSKCGATMPSGIGTAALGVRTNEREAETMPVLRR